METTARRVFQGSEVITHEKAGRHVFATEHSYVSDLLCARAFVFKECVRVQAILGRGEHRREGRLETGGFKVRPGSPVPREVTLR